MPNWASFENQGADLAHQMNCALYRDHHYPIGSGVTKESDLHPIHEKNPTTFCAMRVLGACKTGQ